MTKRNTYFTSPATGRNYWIDGKGIATLVVEEEYDDYLGCQCELDWNCGLHRNRMYTQIERLNDNWASLDWS